MNLLLAGLGTLAGAAVLCLALWRAGRLGPLVAVVGCVAGASLLLGAALPALAGGSGPGETALPWQIPGGALLLDLDALSALFLAVIAVLAVPASLYGLGYLSAALSPLRRAVAFAAFDLLVANMALVVAARDGMLFLIAWEVMTLAAFTLVVFDHEHAAVRRAGLRFLIAAHLGGACLLLLFGILGHGPAGLSFAGMAAEARAAGPALAALLFALALLGFGAKAGLWPLHVWLPDAHPVAPSHASALLSGAMIKTGIYGIARVLHWLSPAPGAHGYGLALLAIGAVTALYGIAYALAQRDFERTLAYSSIENMGVVTCGLGLALLGGTAGAPVVAALAAAGTALHLVNHMAMKGLLFLGAGSVQHATHTRDVERLGGCLRHMPWTGATFLTGAAAISALPPFGGFVGDLLIVAAGLRAAAELPAPLAVAAVLVVLVLVAATAVAAAAFARLGGIVFLGEPRSDAPRGAHDPGPAMRLPLVLLATLVLAIGLVPHRALELLRGATTAIAALGSGHAGAARGIVANAPVDASLAAVVDAAASVALVAILLVVLVLLLSVLRRTLGRAPAAAVATWGCGYSRPGPRLQYTGASFAAPLLRALRLVVTERADEKRAATVLAARVGRVAAAPDRADAALWQPMHRWLLHRLAVARRFQHGRINRYLLAVLAALVAGLLWALVSRWWFAS